jgi:DNA repair protein SbcC/Rad50
VRLLTLEVENYRRFARAALEFGDGVTGLVGRNGAGKSTLVEAIGWALFGHEASRTGKEHLRRSQARPDAATRVRLCFELGGQEYEVTRELQGKGQQHTATLKAGGKVVVAAGANSAREATQAVERALRMDREAFFTSLVARQGELSALSDLTPARRKEVVLRMLRIDAIDGAIALAREERRRLQARLDALAGQRVDPLLLRNQAQALVEAKAKEEAALAEARRGLEGVEASLQAVGRAREAAEALRVRHDALAARAGEARIRGENALRLAQQRRREVQELAVVEEERQRLAPQSALHLQLRAAVEALEQQRDRHRERLRLAQEVQEVERDLALAAERQQALAPDAAQAGAARASLAEAGRLRAAAESHLGELRAHLRTIEEALREAQRGVDRAAARRGELAALGADAPCPTCEQPLAHHLPKLLDKHDQEVAAERARAVALERRRAHQAAQVAQGEGQAREAQAREDAAKKRSEHLVKAEAEALAWQRRRAELEAKLAAKRASLAALGEGTFDEAAYAQQRAEAAALAKAHERFLQLGARLEGRPALEEDLARAEAEAARQQEAFAGLERERAGLAFDPHQRQALEERFLGLTRRAKDLAVEVAQREARVHACDADLARVAQQAEAQRALEAQVAEAQREVVLLERLAGERDAGLLADFRSHLMGRLRPVLGQRAGDLFRACTEGRYEGLELSEDYDLLVLEGGAALPLARFSGGEGDLANLCLRIAIGEVLAERSGEALGFLALDEVLGSQDEQRRARILGALAHLRHRFRQILLITHIEEVKDAVEHVVYVEDGPQGEARLATLEAPMVPA